MLANDLSNALILFEIDCLVLANCIQNGHITLTDWGCISIIEDIITLMATNAEFSILFAPHECNFTADLVAASAFKEVCSIGWVVSPSHSLPVLLAKDAANCVESSNVIYFSAVLDGGG